MRKEQNMPTIAMIVEEQRNLLPLITCDHEYLADEFDNRTHKEKSDAANAFMSNLLMDCDLKKLALLKFAFDALVDGEAVIVTKLPEINEEDDIIYSVRIRGQYGDLNYEVKLSIPQRAIFDGYVMVPKIRFADLYQEHFS